MPKLRRVTRLLGVMVVLALVLTLATDGTVARADGSTGRSRSLAGLWYFDAPVPTPILSITGFINVRQDGTLTWIRNVDAGGPPPPFVPVADMSSTSGQGLWRRAGHHRFEGMAFNINFDNATNEPIGVVRIRFDLELDSGGDTGSGEYVTAWWFCDGAQPCPADPTVVPPDVPEGPAAPWTARRIRMGP